MKTTENQLEFTCEQLESRMMLAGVVSVRIAPSGVVHLNGDHLDNQISISQDQPGDLLRLMIKASGNTTLDAGGSIVGSVTLHVSGVDQIRISLKGGNDNVNLHANTQDFVLPSLLILGGGGSDSIHSTLIGVDDLTIVGGGGDDQFGGSQTAFRGDFRFSGNGGDDNAVFDSSFFYRDVDVASAGAVLSNSVVGIVPGRLAISTAAGNDVVRLLDTTVNSHTIIRTGAGEDVVEISHGSIHRELRIFTGGGSDRVEFNGSLINQTSSDTRIVFGAGNDSLTYDNAPHFFAQLTVLGGAGADRYQSVFAIGNGPIFDVDPVFVSITATF